MIKIAQPLASQSLAENIKRITKKRHDEKNLLTGIKACQKKILSEDHKGLMVFGATVSPMDLITHIPILCEKNEIPYVFVEDSEWINGFTCVFFTCDSDVDLLITEVKELSKTK